MNTKKNPSRPRPALPRPGDERHEPNALERLAVVATRGAGSSLAFGLALASIALWLATGPLFRFSDTWQLVVNTSTTIVTFLMVFLLQRAQNKDSEAVHLKLNEIVAALEGASNRLIGVETLSEADLALLKSHYRELVALAGRDTSLTKTHSIEEAQRRHGTKAV